MERSQVKENVDKLKKKLAELKASVKTPKYCFPNKYFPGIGNITEMQTVEELVHAYGEVKKQTTLGEFHSLCAELGVEEIKNESEPMLGEFKVSDIVDDIKTRIADIKLENKIDEVEEAIDKLNNWKSEADRFADDVEGIDALLED